MTAEELEQDNARRALWDEVNTITREALRAIDAGAFGEAAQRLMRAKDACWDASRKDWRKAQGK